MLQKNIFAATVVTGLLLAPGVLSQQCYNQPNCAGDVVSGPTTAEECCVGTDDGMSFGVSGGTCPVSQCIDPFEVGYVQTIYTVIEDEGPVRVCVNLTKPEVDIEEEVVFVESLDFSSSVADATLAMPDPFNFLTQSYEIITFSDYEQQQLLSNRIRNISINVTRRVICYDQPIYNDMRLEASEYFGMTLTVQGMPPTTALTELRPTYDKVVILILDEDEAVVGLERTIYSVSEDVGVVEVCAIVYSPTIDCPIQFPFNVSLSTSDNTAEHTVDYIKVSRMLSFATCKTRQCVNITIVSDMVDEPVEEFDITLNRTIGLDPRISLQPVDARIVIHGDQVPSHIPLTSSPSSPIVAGDTVTLTRSITLPPGVTSTPDHQSERPGVTSILTSKALKKITWNTTELPSHISLTSSPSSLIVAGDTVTLTRSVTLPPGVTSTPDHQSERPGVTFTSRVPIKEEPIASVVITDNTTSSNPQSPSDNIAAFIGGAVAAICITTIAIIIVIAIIKLRSHRSIRNAAEHEMDSPAVNNVAITTTIPNEAYGQMKGVAITTTPNEAYGQIKGVAITTTPNEAYGQIQQGGGRQEEETPQYEVVTQHPPPPAVSSPLNPPTEECRLYEQVNITV